MGTRGQQQYLYALRETTNVHIIPVMIFIVADAITFSCFSVI